MGNGESTNQNNFQSRNNKGRPQIKTTPIPEVNNIEEEDYHKGIQQYLWKIIVVGDISTGKTALMKRLVHNVFQVQYNPTKQSNFFLKNVVWNSSTKLRLQFWDISGSERYGNSTRVLYNGSVGGVVVLDITSQNSIDGAGMWASDIRSKISLAPKVRLPLILLVNKVDLIPEEDKPKYERIFNSIAQQHGFLGWWMTSAKTNYNVERPFQMLLSKIVKYRDRCPFILQTQIIPFDQKYIEKQVLQDLSAKYDVEDTNENEKEKEKDETNNNNNNDNSDQNSDISTDKKL